MIARRLRALWLASGAFGGEFVLLVAMPGIGHHYGARAVALLGVAIVAANSGKLLGALKMDAAIANADDCKVSATHAAAIACCLATAAVALLLYLGAQAAGALPPATRSAGMAVVVAFLGGALQQATTMRLLRDAHLALYAVFKALPSLALVVLLVALRPASLLHGYELAYAVTTAGAAALHARVPADGWRAAWHRARQALSGARQFVLQGAPGAALDAGNMFALSLVTIAVAGAQAAGEAAQIQRMALAPSLAASLLLSQEAWRARHDGPDGFAAWRRHWGRSAVLSAGAAIISVLLAVLLLSGSFGLVGGQGAGAVAVSACLAPLLAQYATSPLTVYFFKRERLHRYGRVQLAVLVALGAAALTTFLPPGAVGRVGALFVLAAFILGAIGLSSRSAVID